jgi:predicted alpha/beta superfamily hydrolase
MNTICPNTVSKFEMLSAKSAKTCYGRHTVRSQTNSCEFLLLAKTACSIWILMLMACAMLCSTSLAMQTMPNDTVPLGVTGTLKRFEKFPSRYVEARNVDVWLPPDYDKNSNERYAVLYMHDGQNLFEPKFSFIGVDWGIDEALTQLIVQKRVPPVMVVGVWNSPKRRAEYMPQKAFEKLSETEKTEWIAQHGSAAFSDRYLQFLVSELKPFIDSTFRTRPQRESTFIMGSSMGGLISLYAICEYPEVFGGAGCLSTHFPAGKGIMLEYMKDHLPDPSTHKIYFDYGTETVDKDYEPYQRQADEIMKAKGYTNKTWMTRKFVGDEHSERAWRKRVHIPLQFLLTHSD